MYEKITNNWRDEIVDSMLNHLNGVKMSPLKKHLI